ncbi:TPA: hypothetical protein TUW63_001794 [Streptococcus equi subsp. zooepidemicus]|nr:hypothetical protein [Streptococcus equi subsp. zooepidemicus]
MASITNYVKEHYFDEVSRAGTDYFLQNVIRLGVIADELKELVSVEFSEIKYVSAGNREDDLIEIDVLVNIYAEVSRFSIFESEDTQKKNRWLRVSCTALVDDGLKNFQIQSVAPYKSGRISLFEHPLSDELVPFLWKDELDDTAEAILRLYYPDALKSPMQINPYILAQTLELSVEFREINPDTSIFGRIYFEDDTEQEISKMTIVIDRNLEKIRPSGTVNNTIVHECLHWILHRYSVELEKGSADCVIQISTTEEADEKDWMEWQVHSLVPKLMMPKVMTQQFIKAKYAELKENRPVNSMIDIIEDLIKATANYFGVTIIAAQKRLAEFGIEEARGAFNYVDGRYVPAHSWQKGFLGVDQTFSIGLKDLSKLLSDHQSIRNRLSEGGLVYIDSHICLNDSKYIVLSENGLSKMTYYARTHMDECCLVFEKINHRQGSSKVTFINVLNNSARLSITPSFRYPANDGNLDIESKALLLRELSSEINKTRKDLPDDFGGALRYLKEYRKLDNQSLADLSLLSVEYISKLQNNHVKDPSVQTVIALCIAMSLQSQLSDELLKRIGRSLRSVHKDEEMYQLMILSSSDYTVEECNHILIKNGLIPLTTKKDSSI